MSGKAIAIKSLKEKWLSIVQSVKEKGEKGIGGSSTVTLMAQPGLHSATYMVRRKAAKSGIKRKRKKNTMSGGACATPPAHHTPRPDPKAMDVDKINLSPNERAEHIRNRKCFICHCYT